MAISKHIPPRQLLSLILACVVAAALSFPTHFQLLDNLAARAELDSFDSRMVFANWLQDRRTTDSIQLVALTTEDYLELREDIEQRTVYVDLLDIFNNMDVAAVFLDVVFDQPRPKDYFFAQNMGGPDNPDYPDYPPVFIPFLFETLDAHPHAPSEEETAAELEKLNRQNMTDQQLRAHIEGLFEDYEELHDRFIEAHDDQEFELEQQIENELKPINLYWRWLAGREWVERRLAIKPVTNDSEQALPEAQFLSLPSDLLMLNAAGLGFANVEADEEDGVVRNAPLLYRYNGHIYPHLDLVFLCHYYQVKPQDLSIQLGEAISFFPKDSMEEVAIPIDDAGRVLIYYAEGESLIERSFTLVRLFSSGMEDPKLLAGKLVIVGENRQASTEISPIPLAARFSRFGIHAQLIDMVLNGRYLHPAPQWILYLINLLIALLIWLIVNRLSYMRMALALALLLVCHHLLAFSLFTYWNVVIDVARPVLVIIVGSIILMLYRIGFTDREDRRIRRFFNRMVSPEVVSELLESPNCASLAGAKRYVSLLFVDIRGFTPLLEQHEADSILDVLNEYYDRVAQAIVDNNGHVNKFIGDAVFGMFGAPQRVENAEWCAIRAAIQIKRSMAELNASARLQSLGFALITGVGINTGDVVVGMVGGDQTKRDYTALGDAVNVAQRLEALARHGEIMIGESTFQAVRALGPDQVDEIHLRFRKREELALKGKSETITAYEVLFDVEDSDQQAAVEELAQEADALKQGDENEEDELKTAGQ